MYLYHLTPTRIYDNHIKQEGLVPQSIDPGYHDETPDKAIFCWPDYDDHMIKDWIVFSKLKNRNKDDDYILLKIKVPRKVVSSKYEYAHTLTTQVTGSHGITEYTPHDQIPCRLVTAPVPPENITPVLAISTYRAEEIK